MLNFAKYAAMATLAVGLATAATEPASAWGGYGYYRPFYRHHYYGYYRPFYWHHRHHWW